MLPPLQATSRFPELATAILALQVPTLIFDGEVDVYDQRLISRFEPLRTRPREEVATPLFMAFDCLWLEDPDLCHQQPAWAVGAEDILDGHRPSCCQCVGSPVTGSPPGRTCSRRVVRGLALLDPTLNPIPG